MFFFLESLSPSQRRLYSTRRDFLAEAAGRYHFDASADAAEREIAKIGDVALLAKVMSLRAQFAEDAAQAEAIINEVFTPTPEQLAHARRVIAAFAASPGTGVVGIDGLMYDRPHLVRAQTLLARARAAGLE